MNPKTLNKLQNTSVGDVINYYVNGIEKSGTVTSISGSYITLFKSEDGSYSTMHIDETFFVKDILTKNKSWNDMSMEERGELLVTVKAYSPRYLQKTWEQLPTELQSVLKKGALPSKRNIGGIGVKESDLDSEVSNSFAGNAARTRLQGLSGDEKRTMSGQKLSTLGNPKQKSWEQLQKELQKSLELLKVGAPKDVPHENHPEEKYNKYRKILPKKDPPQTRQESAHEGKNVLGTSSRQFESATSSQQPTGQRPTEQESSRGHWKPEEQQPVAQISHENYKVKLPKTGKAPIDSKKALAKLQKSLELLKIEQPKGETISFGDDYKPKTRTRKPSAEVKESKMSKEQQARIQSAQDKYARGKEYGKQKQEERKQQGEVTENTKFIADDGSVHATKESRDTRNTAYGQIMGTDKPPKMYGEDKNKALDLLTHALHLLKSGVEQGAYGNVGGRPNMGVSTQFDMDADDDYEGATHQDFKEQFKHEEKKPEVSHEGHNKKKGAMTTGTGGAFNAVNNNIKRKKQDA